MHFLSFIATEQFAAFLEYSVGLHVQYTVRMRDFAKNPLIT